MARARCSEIRRALSSDSGWSGSQALITAVIAGMSVLMRAVRMIVQALTAIIHSDPVSPNGCPSPAEYHLAESSKYL